MPSKTGWWLLALLFLLVVAAGLLGGARLGREIAALLRTPP
jgi:hypothetical protein